MWIDHNDLSNAHDGLTDVKRASDFVTISWNHFHDHDKTALLGHSDDNAAEDLGTCGRPTSTTGSTAPTSDTRECGSPTRCTC